MLQEATEQDRRGYVFQKCSVVNTPDHSIQCDLCLWVARWAAQASTKSTYRYACDDHLAQVLEPADAYFLVFPFQRGSAS